MYKSSVWLNENDKSSTGSVVCYEGLADWSDKYVHFIEISDCHCKIRLHKTDNDTKEDFCNKLRILSNEILDFLNHIENSDIK